MTIMELLNQATPRTAAAQNFWESLLFLVCNELEELDSEIRPAPIKSLLNRATGIHHPSRDAGNHMRRQFKRNFMG